MEGGAPKPKASWADIQEEWEAALRSRPQEPANSVGSERHDVGKCKPCAFYHTKGCTSGSGCVFCHLCPPLERQRRKRITRQIQQKLLGDSSSHVGAAPFGGHARQRSWQSSAASVAESDTSGGTGDLSQFTEWSDETSPAGWVCPRGDEDLEAPAFCAAESSAAGATESGVSTMPIYALVPATITPEGYVLPTASSPGCAFLPSSSSSSSSQQQQQQQQRPHPPHWHTGAMGPSRETQPRQQPPHVIARAINSRANRRQTGGYVSTPPMAVARRAHTALPMPIKPGQVFPNSTAAAAPVPLAKFAKAPAAAAAAPKASYQKPVQSEAVARPASRTYVPPIPHRACAARPSALIQKPSELSEAALRTISEESAHESSSAASSPSSCSSCSDVNNIRRELVGGDENL